jgi:NB-ARC domain
MEIYCYREIAMHHDPLEIKEEDRTHMLHNNPPTPTSSFPNCKLLGREKEMNDVIELLISETGNECFFSSIPLVGMEVVGKTILAQHVFYIEIVKSGFDLMIWASLPQVEEATHRKYYKVHIVSGSWNHYIMM